MIGKTGSTTFLLILFVSAVSISLASIVRASVPTEWNVVLTATKEGYIDVSDFGMRSDATEGFDTAYDELDPPEPPIGVVSYFWYPDNPTTPINLQRLSTSEIPPSPLMTWTYKIRPIAIDGTFCISWSSSDISTIPLEYGVHLECSDGSTINMRGSTEYCFPAEPSTTYTFTIIVEQIECSVTFYTNPAGVDYSIDFQGKTYHDGESDVFQYGASGDAVANCPADWMFDHWETTGNVDVDGDTVTITCGGTLKAVFTEIPGPVIPEIPVGTIVASAAMIIALVAYVTMPKWRRKQEYINQ